jgi:hypothetical protein
MRLQVCETQFILETRHLTFVPALQEQIDRLAGRALIAGERSDAADHCLAGITRLSGEVKDASTYLPAHDQRTYSDVSSSYLVSVQG